MSDTARAVLKVVLKVYQTAVLLVDKKESHSVVMLEPMMVDQLVDLMDESKAERTVDVTALS